MRVLQQAIRIYTERSQWETAIQFYETLQGVPCERRVHIDETNVDAAKVGGVLLLGADQETLDTLRLVTAVYYVDSLDESYSCLKTNGAEILHGPQTVTGGRNLTARHPDGLIVEYFEPAKKKENA
ncbi:VOC family protein [Terriglobus aquaticus]|uniref:VOC family protein n=1 Tax=Terriglobus aquaticus TaxID=940139 RepID=A0ABW9KNX2_9BACT|nr:VOC family protein [Terriglobus aquaticus]